MLKLGPLSRMIAEQGLDPEPIAAALTNRLEREKTPDGQIAMQSACWLVTARAR